MNFLTELLSKEWVRLVGVLLIGVTIGALFYPTKRIEEKITQKYEQEIASIKESHYKETKDINDKYEASLLENKTLHVESEGKISKLTSEIKSLQSKQKTSYYKLIKPDGTIEIKKFSESEVNESSKVITQIQEEFKTKVDQIETKWSNIHKERTEALVKEFNEKESNYKKTIEELTKTKVTSINEKKFGVEVGVMNDKDYFGNFTVDVWGPWFIGVHGESAPDTKETKVGVGLGIRF